ncbi:amidohydrolase family protein [Scytonema sp. NUACC26]|uniref:amidohydrolase family protein n=1 Tax=Scytonema sp. NUACC26 TaxID=3140176 RepID=UPI0034DBB9E5
MLSTQRIDVHHHILPSLYTNALDRIGQSRSGGADLPPWSQKAALALMDRQGIATAIASISSPGVYFGDAAFARELARQCNEFSAELVREYPQRFGALAILPLPDVDATLQELEYALDTLKLDGVILLASYGDRYLGDPAFDPVFAELNRRHCVILLHPTTPPGSNVPKLDLPSFLVEFVIDTTRALANLIYTGTLERYSNLSIIVSHAGGTVPYIAGRLAVAAELMPHLQEKAPQGAITYLKRLYYDTAISTTPYAMRSLTTLVEPSQILFGTDYPYLPENLIANEVNDLVTNCDLSAEALEAIEHQNARRLFPQFF